MELNVSMMTTGLNILSFQGVTVSNGDCVVSTLDGDLLRVSLNGAIAKWVNLARFGVPAGVASVRGAIVVSVSAQESGNFLLRVDPNGKISSVADLSAIAGEFGAPFGVAVHLSYYYLVAISTDVIQSRGVVVRVTPAGKISQLAQLSSSPIGIAAHPDRFAVTLEDGQLLRMDLSGAVSAIANFLDAGLGRPLGITYDQADLVVTTNTGLLVKVTPDGTLSTLVNLMEAGLGFPTAIATINHSYIVTTNEGYLLRISQNNSALSVT